MLHMLKMLKLKCIELNILTILQKSQSSRTGKSGFQSGISFINKLFHGGAVTGIVLKFIKNYF